MLIMNETNQKLSYKHFDSICRFCLQRAFVLKPIFHDFENEISTADKILTFLNLTVNLWKFSCVFDNLRFFKGYS